MTADCTYYTILKLMFLLLLLLLFVPLLYIKGIHSERWKHIMQ